jgi:hypothetical protein
MIFEGKLIIKHESLLVSGISVSSVVWKRHFNTPTSVPIGKLLLGSLRPIIELFLNKFLSTFGFVFDIAKRKYTK